MKLMLSVLSVFSILVLSSVQVQATEAEGTNLRLDVDENVAELVQVLDIDATAKGFADLSGEQGLVIFFVRSVDWCPYCQRQVIDVSRAHSSFLDAGYKVAVVSYDSPAVIAKVSGLRSITVPLYSDTGSAMIKAFGLLNESYPAESRYYGIPHPAIYVLNNQGVVTDVFAEDGYEKRPDLASVLSVLQK